MFFHHSITDSYGLVKVVVDGNVTSYHCQLCNKDFKDNILSKAKSRLVDHAKSNRHKSLLTYHNNSKTSAVSSDFAENEHNVTSSDNVDDSINPPPYDDENLVINSNAFDESYRVQVVLENLFHQDSSNFVYYFHQILKNGSGLKALIAYSLLDNYTLYTLIHDNTVYLHFNILAMASFLSTQQRDTLAQIFCSIISSDLRLSSSVTENPANSFSIPFPISSQEIRTKYIRGNKSLWHCLPCPEVICSYNLQESKPIRYASVSVKECIAHFLASGGIMMSKEEYCPAALSKLASMNLNIDEHVIFLKIWSDGFEPNHVKQNRGKGLWTVTLTIIGRGTQDSMMVECNNIFPIALCYARHSSTQDLIFHNIIQEINDMYTTAKTFYYAHTQSIIKVRTSILVITMDQPERRKRNFILMGNSKPSNRWGYIVTEYNDTVESKRLPCCEVCLEALKKDTWDYNSNCVTNPCLSCYRWDIALNPHTKKLTHEYLKESVDEVNKELEKDESLSLSQIKKLCIKKGMNESASTHIYDHFHNAETKRKAKDQMLDDHVDQETLKKVCDKMIGPKYQLWSGSPLWNSLSHNLEDVVDSPMHLLFLGVVKSTMYYVSEFVKLRKISHAYETLMRHKIRCIHDVYKLDWFVLIDFKHCGDTLDTTGWLAENYIAFSRIFLWFVSSLRVIKDQRIFSSIDPVLNDNIQQWTKQQLLEFTEENNVVVVRNGKVVEKRKQVNVKELRSIVREFKKTKLSSSNVDEAPLVQVVPPATSTSNECTVEDIILLVQYLHMLIYSIMGKGNINTRNNIERYSRLYLSQMHKITSNMGIDDIHTRLWNLQSLLNLGVMFERYGHIPLYWEGGIGGEGGIKDIKREKAYLPLKNCFPKMLDSLYRRRSLSRLREDLSCSTAAAYRKVAHVYFSRHEIKKLLALHHPISVMWNINNRSHYVCVKFENTIEYIPIKTEEVLLDDIGFWLLIDMRDCDDNVPKISQSDVNTSTCTNVPQILLPSVHLPHHYYTVVSSNW